MNNDSPLWFDTFLSTIPAKQTAREIDFLARNLLQPAYQTILRVCCGTGRHTRALSACGYIVTGLDTRVNALDIVRRMDPETFFVEGDMRALDNPQRDAPEKTFDAVLWQKNCAAIVCTLNWILARRAKFSTGKIFIPTKWLRSPRAAVGMKCCALRISTHIPRRMQMCRAHNIFFRERIINTAWI